MLKFDGELMMLVLQSTTTPITLLFINYIIQTSPQTEAICSVPRNHYFSMLFVW